VSGGELHGLDERRSARLLFASELARGEIGPEDLDRPEVAAAVRSRPVPSRPRRVLERLAMKRGRLTYEGDCAAPFAAARSEVLGDGAAGPPRFLVRVDEFPHYQSGDRPQQYGPEVYDRFHSVLSSAGVPYLVAALPRVPSDPLDPAASGDRPLSDEEVDVMLRLADEGVAFGQHGYDHRTRGSRPRRHSELCGLAPAEAVSRLDRGRAELERAGIHTRVLVPPYNRFDAEQYPLLADRFDVVCGGPETVALLGFHRTPLWRGDAVYLPAYPPLYGRAGAVASAAERLVTRPLGTWAPIVLHWGWESDSGLEDLRRLVDVIAPHAAGWDAFLDAVDASSGS
jgi:uncharacterized protein DUF2334